MLLVAVLTAAYAGIFIVAGACAVSATGDSIDVGVTAAGADVHTGVLLVSSLVLMPLLVLALA